MPGVGGLLINVVVRLDLSSLPFVPVHQPQVLQALHRMQVPQGFTAAIQDPGAYNKDGSPRVHPTVLEAFKACGLRQSLRDQAVGEAWLRMAKESISKGHAGAQVAPPTTTSSAAPGGVDPTPARPTGQQAPLALSQHFASPHTAANTGLSIDLSAFPAGWKPALATEEGVDGVPFKTNLPQVPRKREFSSVSAAVGSTSWNAPKDTPVPPKAQVLRSRLVSALVRQEKKDTEGWFHSKG